ncbi:hypothetical protein JCM5350_002749 [Sporobolomyces pararoseus]
MSNTGYQLPLSQSLPDLSLSASPPPEEDREHLEPSYLNQSLDSFRSRRVEGGGGSEFELELDDDDDDDDDDNRLLPTRTSKAMPIPTDVSTIGTELVPGVGAAEVVQSRSPPPVRTPSSNQRRSSTVSSSRSSRSSSISSLGSIHSAPELLQQPLVHPDNSAPPIPPLDFIGEPPPELQRNRSSQRVVPNGGGKRQSIAVMEQQQQHEREEEDSVNSPEVGTATEEEQRQLKRKLSVTGGSKSIDSSSRKKRRRKREFPNTLWEYFKQEVLTVEVDGEEGIKSERVTNFLTVPQELEKIIFFGFIICLDSFLYSFTILPLRSLSALFSLIKNHSSSWLRWKPITKSLKLSQKCDLIKAVIVIITVVGLQRVTDASKMYHGVRGQETIKLYVLFNVLEIADRLCCSFGQDLSDSLFSTSALSPPPVRRSHRSLPRLRPIFLFTLYTLYVISHSLVLFYQLVTLNVAVNSYSNALLTLLLSNQFVEIKGSVFKKFEKENLFQLTCADIVERFQLALMLFIISLRNLLELSTSIPTTTASSSMMTTTLFPNPSLLVTTFSPALTVLISECFVDWLKHAFITKFNHIRPKVYARYMDVLCKDLIKGQSGRERVGNSQSQSQSSSSSSNLIDQSPSVSRRLGFASLPLSCLVIRVFFQAFKMLGDESGLDECLIMSNQQRSSSATSSSSSSSFGTFVSGWLLSILGESGTRAVEKGIEEIGKWLGVVSVCLGVWFCLILLKLLIGINLRTFASERWNGIAKLEREQEDYKNGRQRPGIGVSQSEAIEIEKTNKLLRDKSFDQPDKPGGGGKDKIELEDLGRYDMVRSRLW